MESECSLPCLQEPATGPYFDPYEPNSHPPCFLKIWFIITLVALGSLVVACLSLGPKIRRFKRAEDDGFLRAMKIRNTISFGGKVKPSATCRKISRYAKHTYEYERDAS
jgi:hypothetical protein